LVKLKAVQLFMMFDIWFLINRVFILQFMTKESIKLNHMTEVRLRRWAGIKYDVW